MLFILLDNKLGNDGAEYISEVLKVNTTTCSYQFRTV